MAGITTWTGNISRSSRCKWTTLRRRRGHRVADRHRRSGLFTIFTLTLLATHVRLIVLNQTTVESLGKTHMKEREKSVLARQFAWHQFRCARPSAAC